MNLLEATESTDRLAPVSETTADDFERSAENRLMQDYARDVASAPMLDREVEARFAADLHEARIVISRLILKLPRTYRDSLLNGHAKGPEAGARWPLKQLDPCCEQLTKHSFKNGDGGVRRIVDEVKSHKAKLDRARDALIVSNLRLVVHLAKEYHSYNMTFMDLVQEGNVGLIEAVERFEHQRGLRFGTYAAWWIRRAILLAFAEKSGLIRTSRYMKKRISDLKTATRELTASLGRQPTSQEIAHRMETPVSKVEELRAMAREPQPLENFGSESTVREILKSVPDRSSTNALHSILDRERREKILAAMEILEPRERKVLEMRFGLGGGSRRTLKEIGRVLRISRERVRQVERLAISRLLSSPVGRELA
jgi:RNA polymerase sigma factor (sigma-70 family)